MILFCCCTKRVSSLPCRATKVEPSQWMSFFAEIVLLIVKSVYFIVESIYKIIVPLPEKSLTDDIVLVSNAACGSREPRSTLRKPSKLFFIYFAHIILLTAIIQITGTGHGIGKCLAMQFADVSAKVVCVDINEQSNAETAKEINAKWKGKAFAYT